ncbi:MAG: hypothetical protein V3V62_13855 [bacterium]
MRVHKRISLPVIIGAPALSDAPLAPEDVSAGGFKVKVDRPPPAGLPIDCSIQVCEEDVGGRRAVVAWFFNNETQPPSWSAGFSIEKFEGSQDEFKTAWTKPPAVKPEDPPARPAGSLPRGPGRELAPRRRNQP